MQLALPPKAAFTSALHTAPSPSASPTRPQPPAFTSMGRLQDSRALPCAGYADFCPRRTELPDPCGVAPHHWIQRPVRRVSSPSFPSQSRVTASTLRAPPLYRWSLETHCSAPPKRTQHPPPLRWGSETRHSPGQCPDTFPSPCPLPQTTSPSWTWLPPRAPQLIPTHTCGARLGHADEAGGDRVPRGQGPPGGGRSRSGGGLKRWGAGPRGGGVGDRSGGRIPRRPVHGPDRGASARPGREKRGRCDAGGAADWLSPGWPRPLRPRKDRLHLKIPQSSCPVRPPTAFGGPQTRPLAARDGGDISQATTPAPDSPWELLASPSQN